MRLVDGQVPATALMPVVVGARLLLCSKSMQAADAAARATAASSVRFFIMCIPPDRFERARRDAQLGISESIELKTPRHKLRRGWKHTMQARPVSGPESGHSRIAIS